MHAIVKSTQMPKDVDLDFNFQHKQCVEKSWCGHNTGFTNPNFGEKQDSNENIDMRIQYIVQCETQIGGYVIFFLFLMAIAGFIFYKKKQKDLWQHPFHQGGDLRENSIQGDLIDM